jgi:hypothetical protein
MPKSNKKESIDVLKTEILTGEEVDTVMRRDKDIPVLKVSDYANIQDTDIEQIEAHVEKRNMFAKLLTVERIIQIIPDETDLQRLATVLRELNSSLKGDTSILSTNTQINNYTTYMEKQIINFENERQSEKKQTRKGKR